MKEFAKILKKLRVEKKLTRTQLSAQLDIKYTTLANYENGLREPDFATLRNIANYFSVTTDLLVGLKQNKTTKSQREI